MIKHFKLYEEIFIRPKDIDPSTPSILYINGSRPLLKEDGSLSIRRKSQLVYNNLSQFGDNVIYPSIYWKDAGEIVFDELVDIIQMNNIKAIVGNSAGGYASFYLSNKYRIPAMSINPAMASTSEAPVIQPIPEEIKTDTIYNKQLIIIGDNDSKINHGVDGQLVIEDLENMKFKGEIKILSNTYHQLSDEQFNDMFIYFYKKYIK